MTVNDGKGRSHQERRERIVVHTVNYVTDSHITHTNAFIRVLNNMNLENMKVLIMQFINNLRELIQKHMLDEKHYI